MSYAAQEEDDRPVPAAATTPAVLEQAHIEEAPDGEVWELENLARARRLGDWIFEQFSAVLGPRVVEVGAGIGTYSERILAAGAEHLLVVEPESSCELRLRERFGGDPRVKVCGETLRNATPLCDEPESFDAAVCLNVLEHIADDAGALHSMAAALRPGGRLALLVPAHPRLYGSLDRIFGHHRRYTRERLRAVVEGAGLEVESMRSFNLLGVPGWWVKNRFRNPRMDPRSLAVYELLLPAWKPIERRLRPRLGLSLVVHARRPAA